MYRPTTSRLRARAAALSFMLVLAASGCGDDDSKSSDSKPGGDGAPRAGGLKRLGVLSSDLPAGYKVKTQNAATSAQKCVAAAFPQLAAALRDRTVKECLYATYVKTVTAPNRRTNTPGSTTIVLETAGEASKALPELRKAFVKSYTPTGAATAATPHSISVSGLGDESLRGVRFPVDFGALAGDVELITYYWRRGNAIVFAGSTDILGDFTEKSTLALAKKVDARIADSRS